MFGVPDEVFVPGLVLACVVWNHVMILGAVAAEARAHGWDVAGPVHRYLPNPQSLELVVVASAVAACAWSGIRNLPIPGYLCVGQLVLLVLASVLASVRGDETRTRRLARIVREARRLRMASPRPGDGTPRVTTPRQKSRAIGRLTPRASPL